jgi:isopenicillin N synthase-like dioxygenase
MAAAGPDQAHGAQASSSEFSRYDQVDKPDYHLAEAADDADAFDEDFAFTTCDLGQYMHGSDAERAGFVDQLGGAMREIGFAILEGHGVDTNLWVKAEGWVEQLFTASSLEDKLRYRAERHGAVSEGYFPVHETSDIHPDLVEGWVFGRRAFDLDNEAGFDAADFWPQPQLESLFRQLIAAELPLFDPIMSAILEGLGCNPNLFQDKLHRPNLGQRLNYYPPLAAKDQASGAGRLLGHEDIDLFTLLPAPTVEGLQVLHRSGKWVRLNAPVGSIILNTGDYLQRISNDILPSTTHRVSPPRDPGQVGRPRFSFPLAAYLRPDELLEVLPNTGTPKYGPIKVVTFHTRTTAKFYGDDYAVEDEVPADTES